jgi:hypothetical protein
MDPGIGAQLEGELAVQDNGGGTNNGRKRKPGVKGKGKEASLASSGTANSKVFFSISVLSGIKSNKFLAGPWVRYVSF